MGTWISSELGKVKGGEKEEWRRTSVTPVPVQVGSLTAASQTPLRAMGQPLPLPKLPAHLGGLGMVSILGR